MKSNLLYSRCMFCKFIYGVQNSLSEMRGYTDGVCDICQPFNLMRIEKQTELRKHYKNFNTNPNRESAYNSWYQIAELKRKISVINVLMEIRRIEISRQYGGSDAYSEMASQENQSG